MKSPMLENIGVEDPKNYSDLQILHSPSGYYIGTIYNDPDGFQEPGSRDSDYFKTQGEAEKFLSLLEDGCQAAINKLRMYP
jgi:hypothetical protein